MMNRDMVDLKRVVNLLNELDSTICDSACRVQGDGINDIYNSHFKMFRLLSESMNKEYNRVVKLNNMAKKRTANKKQTDDLPF